MFLIKLLFFNSWFSPFLPEMNEKQKMIPNIWNDQSRYIQIIRSLM